LLWRGLSDSRQAPPDASTDMVRVTHKRHSELLRDHLRIERASTSQEFGEEELLAAFACPANGKSLKLDDSVPANTALQLTSGAVLLLPDPSANTVTMAGLGATQEWPECVQIVGGGRDAPALSVAGVLSIGSVVRRMVIRDCSLTLAGLPILAFSGSAYSLLLQRVQMNLLSIGETADERSFYRASDAGLLVAQDCTFAFTSWRSGLVDVELPPKPLLAVFYRCKFRGPMRSIFTDVGPDSTVVCIGCAFESDQTPVRTLHVGSRARLVNCAFRGFVVGAK
jgi:hypothetical protein